MRYFEPMNREDYIILIKDLETLLNRECTLEDLIKESAKNLREYEKELRQTRKEIKRQERRI